LERESHGAAPVSKNNSLTARAYDATRNLTPKRKVWRKEWSKLHPRKTTPVDPAVWRANVAAANRKRAGLPPRPIATRLLPRTNLPRGSHPSRYDRLHPKIPNFATDETRQREASRYLDSLLWRPPVENLPMVQDQKADEYIP
jgi:hypothetical protein